MPTNRSTMKKLFILFMLSISALSIKAQTTEAYIEAHVSHAQKLMRIHQLPASIILAVAIHESGAGKSKIAKYLNNHFGVKGANSNTEIKSSYRDYPTVDSSYNHFVSFLQSRSYFNVLFGKYDQYDFTNWAKGIQRGGYAHSRTWASQVIGLIKKYELFKYDDRPEGYTEPIIVATPKIAAKKSVSKSITRYYIIKKGDNLTSIAAKYGTSASAIMQRNRLTTAALQPGQKIKL